MNPTARPKLSLIRAIRPAQTGAAALVPAPTPYLPLTKTKNPVVGSATDATPGTPRPVFLNRFAWLATGVDFCQSGIGKTSLKPPPLAPSLPCQTTSSFIVLWSVVVRRVPPHASA